MSTRERTPRSAQAPSFELARELRDDVPAADYRRLHDRSRESILDGANAARFRWPKRDHVTRTYVNSRRVIGSSVRESTRIAVNSALSEGSNPALSLGQTNTAQALTVSSDPETVDLVDVSPDILAMASVVFPDPHDQALADPRRVRVHVEDGRYFLQATDPRFALITGEPRPHHLAGVVNLDGEKDAQLMQAVNVATENERLFTSAVVPRSACTKRNMSAYARLQRSRRELVLQDLFELPHERCNVL